MGERGFGGPASHVSQAVTVASVAHETRKQRKEDTKYGASSLGRVNPVVLVLAFGFLDTYSILTPREFFS